MAAITKFEDLDCWKKARELVNYVFDICEREKLLKEFSLKDQIKRSAISVMNNIAEGFGRYNNKQFVLFLEYAQASSLEVRSMAYVLLDRSYIDENMFSKLYQLTIECSSQIVGFIKYLENKSK